jgi:hypothetical protein
MKIVYLIQVVRVSSMLYHVVYRYAPSSWVFNMRKIMKDTVEGYFTRKSCCMMEVSLLAAEYLAVTLTFGLGVLSLELRKLTC